MISMVYHTDLNVHNEDNDISEILNIRKGNTLWEVRFVRNNGYRDYWYVGLDASETEDGVPDSVTVGDKVYEGHAGIERLASIPPEMLNGAEQIYSALEEL